MIIHGEAVASMQAMPEGSVDSIVTDPPYGLEFMGKEWDRLALRDEYGNPVRSDADPRATKLGKQRGGGDPFIGKGIRYAAGRPMQDWHHAWATAALRVLRPGGYMLAMGGTRTFHRLACAIEDAGFEMRDTLAWLYGSGFPKGKGCLKPAWEPILLCRKPGPKVLPLGVDECRVPTNPADDIFAKNPHTHGGFGHGDAQVYGNGKGSDYKPGAGRWPANVVHDGSDEVMEAFAEFGESQSPVPYVRSAQRQTPGYSGLGHGDAALNYGDTGTAARFFYCAKASRRERGKGNNHPTVKPLALMRWMVRLVTPKGGTVLDPFGGSGTTALAAQKEGRECITIEREESYVSIIRSRLAECELPMMRTGA